MRDKAKCTAKVKINTTNLTLKTNWRGNEIKTGYQISCSRFDFRKSVLTGIQFMFEIMWRVIAYRNFKKFGKVI